MPIGVIDIGSNTCRLLVARIESHAIVPLEKSRVRLALGEEIERTGGVSETSIAAAAKAVRKLCAIARSPSRGLPLHANPSHKVAPNVKLSDL